LPSDIPIVKNLLYQSFEEGLHKKGYAVRFRRGGDRVAVPSFETLRQGEEERKLVEYTFGNQGTVHLIDSFFYRVNISGNGKVDIVIDPKVSVFVPPSSVPPDVLQRSYLSIICLQDSDQTGSCELLRSSSVKYVGSAENKGLPDTKCVRSARQFLEVLDVKRQESLTLPANILFLEGHPASLGISVLVKKRSLKNPQARRLLTLGFANHLSEYKESIDIPLGETVVKINKFPVSLPIADTLPTGPLTQAKLLGEPRLVVTNAPMYVAPKDALDSDGPYSRNNSLSCHHPSTITLHTIYPKSLELHVKNFVQGLSAGSSSYRGFSSTSPPFYCDLKPVYYPITSPNLVDYTSVISVLRDKVERRDHIVFVVLPDTFGAYLDLKALCYQHEIANQFIKEGTIRSSLSGKFLQFYLWNLGISLYAKAGGTPWRIDNSLLSHTDCYIGIQTKIRQVGRAAPSAFFVGAADIFNSMGEFLSTAVHQGISKSMDGLHVDSEFMKSLVVVALERYKANVNSLPQRIILHRQLDFDRDELRGLTEGLAQVGADCPCIIAHLQEGHHFRGYPLDSQDFTAERSMYYPLGKASVVLFTTGKSQGRYEGGLGTPKPTKVNLKVLNKENGLSPEEIEEVCKSILGFTRLRWNNTRIGIRRPLTIYVADKIGEMAKGGFANLQYRDIRDLL
jgi:hypothetical protein